jgi:hypothetical protein
VRCSGAKVFLTPSHVNESFTAAILVRSLWAAERSSWLAGVLVGWVVGRLLVCWPVVGSVVVAVDMNRCVPVLVCVRCWERGRRLSSAADSSLGGRRINNERSQC